MTDFRALCAELVDELHAYKVANPQHDDSLTTRARAALAAEPQEPTFTTEEVELIQAPWSYLSPPAARPLSPAAQAVLDATSGTYGHYQVAERRRWSAAALRAVADLVLPKQPKFKQATAPEIEMVLSDCLNNARAEILSIANELYTQP